MWKKEFWSNRSGAFNPSQQWIFLFFKPCFLQACLSHIKHHTVSSCLTRTSERIFARAAVLICFFIKFDFDAHVRQWVCSRRANEERDWLEGQQQSVKGQFDEGRASTLDAIFNVPEPFDVHGSSSQPLRRLLDSISERIQRQETRQMWNFPHPESLPADLSGTVTEPLLLCSQMPFSIPVWVPLRGAAPWREPWIQASLKLNLVGILTCFISDLSEHLVINIMGQSQDWRDLPSPKSLLGYFHLEKWAGQVLSFQIFCTILWFFL